MKTYYVTQEELDSIEKLKSLPAPLLAIMDRSYGFEKLYNELPPTDTEWFSYLSGDNTIEFKVKERLYRLTREDDDGDIVYMKFSYGTPDWISDDEYAFKAPLEEIEKWNTPAWEIERAD